jgi:hypothetical protein
MLFSQQSRNIKRYFKIFEQHIIIEKNNKLNGKRRLHTIAHRMCLRKPGKIKKFNSNRI